MTKQLFGCFSFCRLHVILECNYGRYMLFEVLFQFYNFWQLLFLVLVKTMLQSLFSCFFILRLACDCRM